MLPVPARRCPPADLKMALLPLLLLLGPLTLQVACGGNTTISDGQRVEADASVLEITYAAGDSAGSVTKNLTLPKAGSFAGSAISWASTRPAAVSTSGAVNRPPYGADLPVTLTATLTLGGSQATKAFNVTVKQTPYVQFIFTSDSHFGDVTKVAAKFQGSTTAVDAFEVHTRMRDVMNGLPAQTAPGDYGVNAGAAFGRFDFMANTGDIASKSVLPPDSNGNSAAQSWAQWEALYVAGLTLKDNNGDPLPHFLSPGNHDVSNALGGPEVMNPALDPTAFVKVYNRMMSPATPLLNTSFDYNQHKVFYARVLGGIHFVFLNMWLDKEMQEKLGPYVDALPSTTPVILFAHMPPEQTAGNFRDPQSNGLDFPWTRGFSNYFRDKLDLSDVVAPATAVTTATVPTKEVTELATFLKARKNIVAWFHGHDNFNQFRTWNGENGTLINNNMTQLAIPCFRVDSAMKGKDSANDPKKLSFQVVSIDPAKKLFTVRECLWNATNTAGGAIAWGMTETFSLANRVR